jgi:hypothetical protein
VTQSTRTIPRNAATAGVDSRDRSQAWYATEVPSIVAGLQASRKISSTTANQAWQLIESGSYDRALTVVLGEAV